MKGIKGIFVMFLLSLVLNTWALNVWAQNLRLTGFVSDINSGKVIDGVSMYAMVENVTKTLTSSDHEGKFALDFPNGGTALLIEKQGYRTLSLAVRSGQDVANKYPFFVQLPLVPLDAQATDRPYMQSEQKDFVLNAVHEKRENVTRLFKIKDAITDQDISSASVCFEYTKIEKKECKELTPGLPTLSMTFTETDIVSMVVESVGYQTYRGNLILEKMDGSRSAYEVKMTPEITIMTMNLKGGPVGVGLICAMTDSTGQDITMMKGPQNAYFSLTKPGPYRFRVSDKQGQLLYAENIVVQKGLNYRFVEVPDKPIVKVRPEISSKPKLKITAENTTAIPDSVKNVTIYFLQSEHKLVPEAKEKLNQLVLWLQTEPERKIRIEGHSDNVGDPKKNETLSEYRARITYNYMLENGIGEKQMTCAWLGGRRPIENNDSEENKSKNRRVEITLIPTK